MNELQERSKEPVLQYVILCDAVTKDQFGKSVYIGAFDRLLKPGLLPQFVVALKWICGVGSHKFKFRILDPQLNEISPVQKINDIEMSFKTKTDFFLFDFPIINFNFNTPGVYWIEVFLNNHTYLSVPLPVHKP